MMINDDSDFSNEGFCGLYLGRSSSFFNGELAFWGNSESCTDKSCREWPLLDRHRVRSWWWFSAYPLVIQHSYGKTLFLMVKSTVSMVMFHSYVSHYQRVTGRTPRQAAWSCGCHVWWTARNACSRPAPRRHQATRPRLGMGLERRWLVYNVVTTMIDHT